MTFPSSVDASPSDRDMVVVFLLTSLDTTLRVNSLSLPPEEYRVRMTLSHDDFFDTYTYQTSGCILLDIAACHDSIEPFTAALRRRWISLPVIGLFQPQDTHRALDAARFGCWEFVELSHDPNQLAACIQRALQRDREGVDSPFIIRNRLASLGAQERRVLDMTVAGLTSKGIAADMGVRYQTVDKYRRSVLRKMKATNVVKLLNMLHQSMHQARNVNSSLVDSNNSQE